MAKLQIIKSTAVVLMLLSMVACTLTYHVPRDRVQTQTRSSPSTAESGNRQAQAKVPVYRVVRGDTLYSIAWRYRMDFKRLAWWNGIRSPYLIKIGQLIRLQPQPGQNYNPPTTVVRVPPTRPPEPVPTVSNRPAQQPSAPPKPAIVKPELPQPEPAVAKVELKQLSWRWPIRGQLLNTFGSNPGIDIAGKYGQAVLASEAGKVVYSGDGLKGYGDLIIIKHDDKFLSAYAHNSRLLVKEGDQVYSGQTIAQLGKVADTSLLHFEIRIDGTPVDPEKYLPRL